MAAKLTTAAHCIPGTEVKLPGQDNQSKALDPETKTSAYPAKEKKKTLPGTQNSAQKSTGDLRRDVETRKQPRKHGQNWTRTKVVHKSRRRTGVPPCDRHTGRISPALLVAQAND